MLLEKNLKKLYDEVSDLIFNDWLLDKFQKNLKLCESYNNLNLIADDLEVLSLQDYANSIKKHL